MAYTHDGKNPVVLIDDPMSVGSTDWVFFVLGGFLRANETVYAHAATVTGGILLDSRYLGSVTDPCGNTYLEVYGVKVKAPAIPATITVVFTFSTTVSGNLDIGRNDVSRTVRIPVRVL